VNNSGQVVGGALNNVPDTLPNPFYYVSPLPFPVSTQTHAFLWSRGTLLDLGTLGGPDSFAQFVNEAGQAAGVSYTNSTPNGTTGFPTLDPFIWANGHMKDLGTLGGTMGFANGINNQGHVIGQSNLAGDTTFHPFLWAAGHMQDLQTLGGNNGSAIWITEAGAVAGWADLPGSQVHHAFIWRNGKMTDLGTVGTDPCSTAYAANSQGQVVGNSGDGSGSGACGPKLHGFLSANGGPAVDLDTLYAPLASGMHFSGACCISESGEILGFGFLANGDTHALLMIPCDAKHPDNPDCHTSPADIAATGTIAGNPAPGANSPLAGDMMRKISPYITHPW
jgi:probable HAF family extracellular repeat protein